MELTPKRKLFNFVRDYDYSYIVLEFKSGQLGIVVNSVIIYKDFTGFDSLEILNEELEASCYNDYVIKIYQGSGYGVKAYDAFIKRELLWERDTELTIDQIAEKFDIPVSQLKIKK